MLVIFFVPFSTHHAKRWSIRRFDQLILPLIYFLKVGCFLRVVQYTSGAAHRICFSTRRHRKMLLVLPQYFQKYFFQHSHFETVNHSRIATIPSLCLHILRTLNRSRLYFAYTNWIVSLV